jgi:hypothetical protein
VVEHAQQRVNVLPQFSDLFKLAALNLQNGDVVWVALNDSVTVIEKFELWYYPDGSKPKTTTA